MSFYDNSTAIKNKIETALVDKNLVLTVRETYPATLIISQSQSPYAQMELASFGEDGVSSKDSALRFIFEVGGLKIHTDNRLIIPDDFMTKLKGLAKKWYSAYTAAFHAEHSQRGSDCDTGDTGDTVIDAELTDDDEEESVIDSADNVIDDDPDGNTEEFGADEDGFPIEDEAVIEEATAAASAEDPFADFMGDDHNVSGLLGDE